MEDSGVDRRAFLKAFVITAAAATGVGGGMALLKREPGETVITAVAPPAPTVPPVTTIQDTGRTTELLSQLASSQAENMRLAAELAAAQRQLDALNAANGEAGAANETLQLELTEAHNQIGLLSGLVALYEQLDEVELDAVLENGLSAVGDTLNGLVERLPSLEEGLTAGRDALDELDRQIPLLASGRDWLDVQTDRLSGFYQAAEDVLASVLDRIGDFFELLNDWFQDVLKWLPFGTGEKASNVMTALTNLIQETPATVTGLQSNVAEPLALWVGRRGEEAPLKGKVVMALREKALDPAGEVAGQARDARQQYLTQLAAPVQATTERRRLVRQLIQDYREKYQV